MKNVDCRTPTLYFWSQTRPIQKSLKLRSLHPSPMTPDPWNTQIPWNCRIWTRASWKGNHQRVSLCCGASWAHSLQRSWPSSERPRESIVEHKMLELPSSEFSRPFLNWEFIIYWFFKFQFLLFSFLERDGLMLLVFLNFYSCASYFWKKMSRICFCCQVHAFSIHVGPILFLWGSFCCHAFFEGKYQTHILSTRFQFILFIYLFALYNWVFI